MNKPVVSRLFWTPLTDSKNRLTKRVTDFFAIGNFGGRTSKKNCGKLPFGPKINFVK